jgi:hypothetical protein
VRGAFAAGKNYSGDACEVLGAADERVGDAELVEHFGVGFIVTLDRDDSDFKWCGHFVICSKCELVLKVMAEILQSSWTDAFRMT